MTDVPLQKEMLKKTTSRCRARLARLWANERGDSMVEALVAILIAALGASLLATMVMASTNVASSSQTTLQNLYKAESDTAVQWVQHAYVNIGFGDKDESVKVDVYGSSDGEFFRYQHMQGQGGS